MKQENPKEIALLIFRRILEKITPEETARLEEWRKASPHNENCYQKLLDKTFLEREYQRMKAVNASRPLKDMQARIGQKRIKRWIRVSAAAAVAGFAFWGISILKSPDPLPIETQAGQQTNYASQIRHGETKALLTTEDGTTVQLGANANQNEEIIKRIPHHPRRQTGKKTELKLNRLTTPRGSEFRITLEDGTQVWLNAESQLSYPDTFRRNERRVSLKGEAYFQVAKNEESPFYVEADGQSVRVYGTEFNIRSYQEDDAIYTTLVSGSISLQPANGTNAALFLAPGHQAIFDKNDFSTRIRPIDTEIVTSWRKGKFVFEEQNLGQIMCTLGRWYNFDYEFTDNVLSETVFKGSVPRYSDFNEVLEILEKSGGLKFRVQDRTVIVSLR